MLRLDEILKDILRESCNEDIKHDKVDMKEKNPRQISGIDWADVKNADDEWNNAHPKSKKKVDSLSDYRREKALDAAEIRTLEDELTDKIQKKTGKKTFTLDDLAKNKRISKGAMTSYGEKGKKSKKKINNGVYGQSFTFGNTKLPPSTLVVNITDALNCPTKSCPMRGICFGVKGEERWGDYQLKNLRNNNAFHTLSPKDIIKWIESYIEHAPIRITQIRISEVGDFESQEQIDFADRMAGRFEDKYGIKTTCYTHRDDLDFSKCKHLVVNMSTPTSPQGDRHYLACSEQMFNTLKDGMNILTKDNIVPGENGKIAPLDRQFKDLLGKPYFKCHCDCVKCNFCYQTKEENGEPDEQVNVICQEH